MKATNQQCETLLRRFKILALFVSFATLITVLAGCYGRPSPHTASVSPTTFGIVQGRAAVVSFSALWCHPCREEIESLNRANQEFSGQVQILGYLVEGEEKGSAVRETDIESFTSFDGEKPLYNIRTDQNWQLFDGLRAPEGRALPTLVIFNQQGQLQEIIQQSLDYETQLRPLLQALARGESPAPINNNPTPAPIHSPGTQSTDTVQNWSVRSEVSAHPSLLANLTASWQTGLSKYDFTPAEMPLDAGQITFFTDTNGVDTPQGVHWTANTPVSICQLQLNLNADGTLATASGSCRPK